MYNAWGEWKCGQRQVACTIEDPFHQVLPWRRTGEDVQLSGFEYDEEGRQLLQRSEALAAAAVARRASFDTRVSQAASSVACSPLGMSPSNSHAQVRNMGKGWV